jgi:hypothetical protein
MRTRPLMTLRLSTAPTQNIGAGPHGTRVTFPITGGSFEGDRLRGKVLPDSVIELDLRITLGTDDGALRFAPACGSAVSEASSVAIGCIRLT